MRDFKKGGRAPVKRSGGFKGAPRRDFSTPAEMHQATCATCKKTCEVPFRPNGKKPVFCRDCFPSNKGDTPTRTFSSARPRSGGATSYSESTEHRGGDLQSQIEKLSLKLDALIRMVEGLKR